MNTIIGIAGGSGSGKTTMAIMMVQKYPSQYAVVHLDDYFKKKEDLSPTLVVDGKVNWEHPETIDFDRLYTDICALREGKAVTVSTKSELYHPTYTTALDNRILYTIEPKSIIIVEGYLALYDKRIRDLMDIKIYLDIPIAESIRRRSANKFSVDADYFETILAPTHTAYVLPTMQYADLVIDVLTHDKEEVFAIIEKRLVSRDDS